MTDVIVITLISLFPSCNTHNTITTFNAQKNDFELIHLPGFSAIFLQMCSSINSQHYKYNNLCIFLCIRLIKNTAPQFLLRLIVVKITVYYTRLAKTNILSFCLSYCSVAVKGKTKRTSSNI